MKMVNVIAGPRGREKLHKQVTQTQIVPASMVPAPLPQLMPVVLWEVSSDKRMKEAKPHAWFMFRSAWCVDTSQKCVAAVLQTI